jgi:hypothetical protein
MVRGSTAFATRHCETVFGDLTQVRTIDVCKVSSGSSAHALHIVAIKGANGLYLSRNSTAPGRDLARH